VRVVQTATGVLQNAVVGGFTLERDWGSRNGTNPAFNLGTNRGLTLHGFDTTYRF
jgi:hypothetical protein